MRPALDGHAGIPQETRLLFRGLNALPGIDVHGLLQSSHRALAPGLPARRHGRLIDDCGLPRAEQVNRLAQVVVSLQQSPGILLPKRVSNVLALLKSGFSLAGRHLTGTSVELTHFEAEHFRDFIWRALFAKTLEPSDIDAVIAEGYRVVTAPWGVMHRFGLLGRALTGFATYPRIDTRGFDMFIAETPYPGHVAPGTTMVVRYHDAIPMLMPHTISDKAYHQASHFRALRANVFAGAHFSCVSESTRTDLLAMFPEVESRSVTIHNMVSRFYFAETRSPERIPEILRMRRNVAAGGHAEGIVLGPQGEAPQYLLMVSTIEPRKNHLNLLSAWERLRAQPGHAGLRLVLVGMLGWEQKKIVRKFRPWLDRGEMVMLEDVPADELRLLYRHARATVCPSFYEGFDFSGIEAMRCGGVVAASDIPVHREIYHDASAYFSPYSPEEMATVIGALISDEARRAERIERGAAVSAAYTPDAMLPQWQEFLAQRMAAPEVKA